MFFFRCLLDYGFSSILILGIMSRRRMMMGQKLLVDDVNTILLMHFDNDMVDSSPYKRVFNNPYSTFVTGKFNNAVDIYNSTRPYCDISGIDWSQGFTIEFFAKFSTVQNGDFYGILGTYDISSNTSENSGFAVRFTAYNNDGFYMTVKGVGEEGTYFWSMVMPTVDSTYHHYAFVYNNSTLKLYVDGVLKSTVSPGAKTISPTTLYLGRWTTYNTGNNTPVQIDELRISNVVRWTADFTPPTTPYTI